MAYCNTVTRGKPKILFQMHYAAVGEASFPFLLLLIYEAAPSNQPMLATSV